MTRKLSIGMALAFLTLAAPALSHRPRLVEGNASHANAYLIEDPETSWAFYADLESEGRVEYFRFRLPAASQVAPELIVPDEPAFDDFEPTFLIYALAGSADFPLSATASEVPLPEGARAVAAQRIDEDEFEGLTRKSFRKVAQYTGTLPAGEYGVAIYSPARRTGEYVFVIGSAEEFDSSDLAPMVNGCGRIFF